MFMNVLLCDAFVDHVLVMCRFTKLVKQFCQIASTPEKGNLTKLICLSALSLKAFVSISLNDLVFFVLFSVKQLKAKKR